MAAQRSFIMRPAHLCEPCFAFSAGARLERPRRLCATTSASALGTTAFLSTRRNVMSVVSSPHHASLSMQTDAFAQAASSIGILQPSDAGLALGILVFVAGWLALWQRLTALHVVSSTVTRKVIHISCGPGFVLLWPFFSDDPSARFVASSIPLLFIAILVFTGSAQDGDGRRGALGRALSRNGGAREALQGPLYYSTVLLASVLLLFKTATGAVAIMQLCFGDAAAEIFGRRFGAQSQWGRSWTNKSVAGSAAFVVTALFGSSGAVAWLHYNGLSKLVVDEPDVFAKLAAVSIVCAGCELLPKAVVGDDNFTIATTAIMLMLLLFGPAAL